MNCEACGHDEQDHRMFETDEECGACGHSCELILPDTPTPAAPAGGEWTSGYSEEFEHFTVYQGKFDASRLGRDQFLTPDEQSSGTAERVLNSLTADLAAARARIEELEERLRCKAPIIQYDPDCDYDSDPIEKVLYIVANNVAKHTIGKHWDCQDTCWLEDLEAARAIIRGEVNAARAEAEQLKAKAELADEVEQRARGKSGYDPLYRAELEYGFRHFETEPEAVIEEWGITDWLARYDALQATHEQGGEGR